MYLHRTVSNTMLPSEGCTQSLAGLCLFLNISGHEVTRRPAVPVREEGISNLTVDMPPQKARTQRLSGLLLILTIKPRSEEGLSNLTVDLPPQKVRTQSLSGLLLIFTIMTSTEGSFLVSSYCPHF